MKKFNNTENTPHKIIDLNRLKEILSDKPELYDELIRNSKLVWESRSVAVAATIMVQCKGERYVLIGKRGPNAADFQGHWNLICGYLDKDETLQEATEREVWEESGLDLDLLKDNLIIDNLSFPWRVHSHPTANRQNVTNHFACVAKVDELPKLSTDNNEIEGEIEELRWLPISEIDIPYKWAFGHDKVIKKYIELINKN